MSSPDPMPPTSFIFCAPSQAVSSTIWFVRRTTQSFRRSSVGETSRRPLSANEIAVVDEAPRGPRRPRRCVGGDAAIRAECHLGHDMVAVRADQWCTRAGFVVLAQERRLQYD